MKLNLGCGTKKLKGYENIDINPNVNPDTLYDIANDGLKAWGDNSVDEIRAFDFLEHIPLGKTIFVIEEIWRVLKDGGKFEHLTPSTDGRGAFQDPTHLSFWNINTWLYYTIDGAREQIGTKAKFKTESLVDIITHNSGQVIHTHGLMYADKK